MKFATTANQAQCVQRYLLQLHALCSELAKQVFMLRVHLLLHCVRRWRLRLLGHLLLKELQPEKSEPAQRLSLDIIRHGMVKIR